MFTRTRVVTLFWYRGFPGVSFILELADIKVLVFFNVAFLELTSASSDECGDRLLLLFEWFMTFSASVLVKMGLVKFVGAARIRSVDHRITSPMC